jgi:hypothetical protein
MVRSLGECYRKENTVICNRRSAAVLAGSVALAFSLFSSGCWNPFSPDTGGDEPPQQYYNNPDTTTELLHNFQLSWNQQQHDYYMGCLEETFEFHLLEVDWDDYDGDGLVDTYWGVSTEEEFTEVLFDSAFAIDLSLEGDFEVPYTGDSTGVARECHRTFVLKVYLDENLQSGYQATGDAIFVLRPDTAGVWYMWLWFDQSDI